MYFGKSKSKDSKSSFNYLKLIKYWHRPAGGLNEVILKMQERGINDPTKLGNNYIELYAGSFLVMGLQESDGKEYWIAKPEGDPPDMVFMTVISSAKNKLYFHAREIEIIRYVPQLSSRNDLLETILSKDKKGYPEDYIILCFLETNGQTSLRKLSAQLTSQLKHLEHVFVVFHGVVGDAVDVDMSYGEMSRKISLVQLAPKYDCKTFDILDCWKKGLNDNKKLLYLDSQTVYHGLRRGDIDYPKILSN